MYPPSNQIQSPDDEEEDQSEELDDGENSISKDSAIKEAGEDTFHSYYNQNFVQTQDFRVKSLDSQNEKWPDFLCSGAVLSSSSPTKISYERLVQEGFNLASPILKTKKRKAIEVHGDGGGGGRVVRSSGRKDRHSKVRTARGPRDRRVRLSPGTAIQFYDVQDRLGYDRPSKAIDWLIKEAKTAIDALDELPSAAGIHSPPITKDGGFLISECVMIEKHEHSINDDDNPAPGFSFCLEGAAPPSPAELQAFLDQELNASSYQQGFCSALTATSETSWEIARLQKLLTWNCGNENPGNARGGGGGGGGGGVGEEYSSVNSLPLHFPVQPISGHGHMFSLREPLQSSIINFSSINADFPGFNFCNELSNITASATMREDEKDTKLVFGRPSSTAPFLHYED